MCVLCKTRYEKSQLIRYTNKNDVAVVDDTKTHLGRGAYMCHNCSTQVQTFPESKKRVLEKQLTLHLKRKDSHE